MSKDKKGKPTKDDGGAGEMGLGGEQGYEPYVFYEFEII